MSPAVRGPVAGVLLALLGAAAFALHTARYGAAELRASDAAWSARERERAVRHAQHAASALLPGAAHVEAAYGRLRAIALDAERRADHELAASAWQAMRAAALDSEHLWQPHERELSLAHQHLARLGGAPSAAAAGLERRLTPGRPRWLLGFGFLVALGSLSWLGLGGAEGSRWRLVRAAWPALGWCVGLLAMGWALLHA